MSLPDTNPRHDARLSEEHARAACRAETGSGFGVLFANRT
ncbi:hypothetical protein BURMUCF1_A1899 [Burkholderia multivorans ATCC BAA-247]|jgi:hypothetical protein|uniref:Uncharacterized protein n=1 Tax=Burkholderia multivorans CGD2 TaxID=513052 RepID=B9BLI9_9BURK|nr:hypothetical protein BURMUCGD2_5947 [Burkholderia multivorans CGD2]EEE16492.1 hypothetical protein BURMUCGD2M_5937 [Burkholderia multivorans CGD2M]EJO53914.1 hypothetical protein BURMUCF2_A2010 [Burkholderia multivorans CF2]EJO62178.1 hypothetical protein BURMUCF1_A1899 [Burkholderia multivorans ATCC BAA-247]